MARYDRAITVFSPDGTYFSEHGDDDDAHMQSLHDTSHISFMKQADCIRLNMLTKQ